MKKQSLFEKLTYSQKVDILRRYYETNFETDKQKAMLAKEMSDIIYYAMKLSDVISIDIIDEILKERTELKTELTPCDPIEVLPNGVKVLAKCQTTLVSFTPTVNTYEKIDILKKYINHELLKKQINTNKFAER